MSEAFELRNKDPIVTPLTLGLGGCVEAFPLELLGQQSQLAPVLLPRASPCLASPTESQDSVCVPFWLGWKSLDQNVHRRIQPPLVLPAHQSPLPGTLATKHFGGVVVPVLCKLIGLKRDVSGR